MSAGRALVVELFGVAGAGKTTLVDALMQPGGEFRAGIDLSRLETLPLYVRHVARFLPAYLLHHRGTRWLSLSELRAMGYLRAWHRRIADHPPREGVLLLDHGPLFRLALLGELGPPLTAGPAFRRWWRDTLERWARALDLIVWLDAPDPILLPRIRNRAQEHLVKQASDAEMLQFLDGYRRAYGRVVEQLRGIAPVPLLRFDTGARTPEELGRELAGAIRAVRREKAEAPLPPVSRVTRAEA